jgi:hypothetical protein
MGLASNYLSVRGKFQQDKERMVRELEKVMVAGDLSLLRPEFLKGL